MCIRTKTWLASLLALTLLAACGSDDDDGKTADTTPTLDQFAEVQLGLKAYVESEISPVIKAQALYDNLNDGDTSNDPFILSVRSAEQYAKGHIKGAINIPWKAVGKADKLVLLPKDKTIVVYCYTGHTGGVATTALRAMGYQAVNMKHGMVAWTKDAEIRGTKPYTVGTDDHDFPIETKANVPTATYALPTLNVSDSTEPSEVVRAAVDAYVGGEAAPVIKAQAVYDNLNDGDTSNDPLILSVRSAEHYAKGHLPGAINIPWRTVTKDENLKLLPTDRDIVVYCYTGHTGGVATTALRLLGYKAVNMKFGIMSWTKDADARVQKPFSDATDAHDFPTVK